MAAETITPPGIGADIRVLIIEDHVMVAESLGRVLGSEPDIDVVGLAASAVDGVDAARSLQPDVVLLDYCLPGNVDLHTLHRVRHVAPNSRVVLLTGFGGPQVASRALAAGALYVEKTQAIGQLPAAIRRAATDGAPDPRDPAAESADDAVGEGVRTGELSARQLEILHLFAEGATSRDLAERLGLSVHTVRKHVQNILTRLGAHSKLDAVRIARQRGLLPRP